MSFKTKNRNGTRPKAESLTEGGNSSAGPANERALQQMTAKGNVGPPPSYAEGMAEARKMLTQATGVKDLDLAARIIGQVSHIQAVWPLGNASGAVQAAADIMLEIKPESLMEALLATQMIGVHHAGLSCLLRTAFPGKSVEDLDAYARVATRLMRLSMEQVEVMTKLKGKTGRQKVTVEQVHVHDGGQAIVGAVSTAPKAEGGGVMRKSAVLQVQDGSEIQKVVPGDERQIRDLNCSSEKPFGKGRRPPGPVATRPAQFRG